MSPSRWMIASWSSTICRMVSLVGTVSACLNLARTETCPPSSRRRLRHRSEIRRLDSLQLSFVPQNSSLSTHSHLISFLASRLVVASTYPATSLSLRRTLLGSSQTSGTFRTLITNPTSVPVETMLLEEHPWWIGLYLSERVLSLSGVPRRPSFISPLFSARITAHGSVYLQRISIAAQT